ncbi:PstS family phosphate ABC transporter substrate-binding protein [Bdellovibrio bacteriovorus]|uniref:Phosphate-binding protein n=1 Tax=Bdellovibrio bacteriovorus TaxID=959 RepID=A0A150WC80_BDEBC|nr:PstS family phosphate ABC transporter substrate-binding protein [Bdellovibrio bacteriovorus]KYG60480.1 protein sphX [Bdellovibrio bacteriovorus]
MIKNAILSLCVVLGASAAHAQVPVIKIDGSSTVFPITEAMAEEFQTAQKGKVRVTVGISGTGGGFKKFCRGEIDIQDASRPIQSSELEACRKAGIKFLEIAVAYDATAVVVNPKNTWLNSISVADLKKMWEPAAQGKIQKWSDINPAWPKQNLKLYGAGSDSGTFDYFTEAIVGKSKSSRGDYTASEDDNTLVTGVSQDLYALGYVPLAYYEENKAKLKVVGIIGGDKAPKKEAVTPSRQTVEAGTYFPLSRPIFIYVNEASMKKAEVKDFVNFYLSNSAQIVPEVKYVPLPAKAYELGKEHVKKNKLGTVFGGHSEVGLKIEELLKREGSL